MDDMRRAADTGSRLEALKALRSILADQLDICESARDVAALSRQMTDVLRQIEELENGTEGGTTKEEGSRFEELIARLPAA